MFIGHFAVALAAKRSAPRTSLGVLFAACQLPDLIWPVLLLLGWERVRITPGATAFNPLEFVHYPISHSLLATFGWAVLAGALYWWVRRDRKSSVIVGALVVSHWVLDWITHRPDLPLYPSGPELGLGLWDSVAATLVLETVLFGMGLGVYLLVARPRSLGAWASLGGLVALLLFIYFGGVGAPPPPDVQSLAAFALAAWILPFWAHWADRKRGENDVASSAPGAGSAAESRGPMTTVRP